jgi:nucleoid DNA-binding protein
VTKRELVIDVAERLGFTQNEVADVVQATLDAIVESLAEGERLEIRNFGVFEVKTRDARMGRNPRTGQEVPIHQKRVATFKPGKALKELVQTGNLAAYEEEVGRTISSPEAARFIPQAATTGSDVPDGRPSGVL